MKFTDSLKGIGSPIAFYPDLIPIAGSPESAIFLCQLTYWTGKQHDPDGWIHKTQEEWFFEIGLTEKQQKTAREKLVGRSLIEEREIGSPARLQYRVNIETISAVWDVWTIIAKIKKQFEDLKGTYGILMSRGILNLQIKTQIEHIRTVIRKCHTIANGFFEGCEKMRVSPLGIIDGFRKNLIKVAQTLATGLISQREIQVPPDRTYKSPPTGDTSTSHPEIQVPPDGRLAPPSIPVPVTAPVPSKITPKTSTETSPESVHPDPENTHTWGPPFKNLDHEIDQELVQKVEVEVLHDTQQETGDKESNSQGQHCIFMEGNIPGGAGGENFDKLPDWVYQLHEKVRLGHKLERSELLSLAEHTLGDYASLYRESGQVLNVGADDIRTDFLKFVQWYSFNGNPDINYVLCSVKKAERNPEQWDVLVSWLQTWEEVQKDPKSLETILAAKVSSQGKRCNSEDLRMNNRLVLEKPLSTGNLWDEI